MKNKVNKFGLVEIVENHRRVNKGVLLGSGGGGDREGPLLTQGMSSSLPLHRACTHSAITHPQLWARLCVKPQLLKGCSHSQPSSRLEVCVGLPGASAACPPVGRALIP